MVNYVLEKPYGTLEDYLSSDKQISKGFPSTHAQHNFMYFSAPFHSILNDFSHTCTCALTMNLFRLYSKCLNENPLPTKMVSAGIVFSLGDCIAQRLLEQNERHDFRRTGRLAIVGSSFLAPVQHYWFRKLPQLCERFIFSKYPNMKPFHKTLVIVSVDQTLFAPFVTVYFLMATNILEFYSYQKGIACIKQKFTEIMKQSYKVWPLAQTVNYSFVPPPFRVLFANLVGLFWNSYLSKVRHRR